MDRKCKSYQRRGRGDVCLSVCACMGGCVYLHCVQFVCLQGELRCWDLASLLFNEYLWRWQVHVQPFFYKLSNKQASPLSPTAITTVISRITLSTTPKQAILLLNPHKTLLKYWHQHTHLDLSQQFKKRIQK